MAITRGHPELSKYSYYKELFKNPFWAFLIGICVIFFLIASSPLTYGVAAALTALSIFIIILAYFGEEFHLHHRVYRKLRKLDDDYILLSSLKISDGYDHTCTSYILISHKGIFNIKLLDFTGIVKGDEDDPIWEFADAHNAYNILNKKIKNPITKLRKSQKVIESLLEKNHINYLFFQSIFVINNSNATFKSNTNIPVVKLNELNHYIMSYADRPNMVHIKDDVVTSILSGHRGSCCLKMFCAE